jgi:hypothetical protein
MVPVVYFLGGVLVRAASKKVAQRLVARGFRKATKGQINSKIKIVDGTENNLISLITRALAKIKGDKPKAPSGPAPRGANQKSVPQSRIGKKGPEKLGNYGLPGSLPKRVPKKSLSGAGPKPVPKSTTTPTTSVPNRLAQGLNIAAAGGIAKVAYDAYKDREAANKKFEEARRARSDLSTAKDKRSLARKVRAAKNVAVAKENKVAAEKKLDQQVTKMLSKSPKEQAEAADTPARKKAIMRALKEAMDFQSDKNKGK